MGLFDRIAGAALGKLGGDKGAMVQVAMDLFNQNGGLEGILEKFKAAGFSAEEASWVSKGENLPISAEQIKQVLGSGTLADIAAKLGTSPSDIGNKIAEYLPQVIDKMTPNGEVDANSANLMSALLGLLK
jgi:uncharacterized protein YidB (DUF937 family)